MGAIDVDFKVVPGKVANCLKAVFLDGVNVFGQNEAFTEQVEDFLCRETRQDFYGFGREDPTKFVCSRPSCVAL